MTELLIDPSTWVLLAGVALLAGFIDAIVGGGGMLTVPALLSLGLPPHLTLGTNKLAACFASGTAAYTYFKKQLFTPAFWKNSLYSTFLGALLGTVLVNFVSSQWLEKLLPIVIFVVAIYTLLNRKPE